jgi:hypothetical protein
VIAQGRAAAIVEQTIAALSEALERVEPNPGVSVGLVERLRWNVQRLQAGAEISTPKS